MSYKNILFDDSLTYDDVSLLPNQISSVTHRADCDTSVEFCGVKLAVPIIASPMNTVCGGRMAKSLSEMNCLGVIHRFNSTDEQISEFVDNDMHETDLKAAAIE